MPHIILLNSADNPKDSGVCSSPSYSPQSSEPIQSTEQATHNGYEIPLHKLHTSTNGIHTTETRKTHKEDSGVFLRFLYVQAQYKPKHMIPIDACITISQNATELPLYLLFQATNLTDVPECCIRKHLLYHLHHLM